MSLQQHVQEAQTALFEELGVFFAFSNEQFEEGAKKYGHLKPEGTKWAALGAGMYMPKVNLDAFFIRHNKLMKTGIKADLSENERAKILDREMSNYEIGYAFNGHRDENFRSAIDGYGFTEDEIVAAYTKHMQEHEY